MPKLRHQSIEAVFERSARLVPGRAREIHSPYVIANRAVLDKGAMQNQNELAHFLELVKKKNRRGPAQVTEIGTERGGNLFALAQVAHPNAQLISIDLPGGNGGGGYRLRDEFRIARMRRKNQGIHFVRGDSHDTGSEPASTRSRLLKDLGGRAIDLLFIDGDHSYDGVKQDFETYSRLVGEGGIIALHDVAPNPTNKKIEVPRYWKVLKEFFQENSHVFIDDYPAQRLAADEGGIGVITDWQPERLDEFVEFSRRA